MYRDSHLKLIFPALLMVALLVLPAGAACPVSWRDKTLTYTRACTMIDAFDNLSQVDPWMVSNISGVLYAELLNRTSDFNLLLISEALNRSVDKAAIILEMENQQAANLTHTANEIYIGTERNISLSVDGAASNLSHEVDAGAVNLSEGKAAVLSTVSGWIQDPANKTAPYSPTGAPAVFNTSNMSVVTAPLYDVNGSWVIPDPGGGNVFIMNGVDWGITPNSTLWLTGLYIRGHLNVVPPVSCSLWTGGPAQTWKIWRSPPSGAVELLGNVSVCDIPFGDYVNENQTWVGVRFAHPVMVTPNDIVGFHNDYLVMVSTNGSVPYDNNVAYYGDFSPGGFIIPHGFGVDVIGTSDDPAFIARVAEDVATVGDTSVENRVYSGVDLNRTHDFNQGQISASANITTSMPLAGNTSVPATSTADDIMTFLDATAHTFADSGYTIEQVINQALVRDTNTSAGITLGAVGQQQNPLIEANRTGAENTAAHMVAANLTLGGNVSVPDVSTSNGIVVFADALGHTFSDSGRLLSEFLTTFAPAIKEMEDQMGANLTHEHNEGILAHVLNDTSLENRIYFSIWANGTIFGNWSFMAPMMKEIENQYTANDTATLGIVDTWIADNLTATGNVFGPPSSTEHGLAAFADTLGHTLEDTGMLVSDFLTTFAPAIKEMEDQLTFNLTHEHNEGILAHVFNDTHWFNEGVLSALLNDTHWQDLTLKAVQTNQSLLINNTGADAARVGAVNDAFIGVIPNLSTSQGAAIKWASDSDTLNDTATKAAAIKTAGDLISTNITPTADIRLMAYQFVTPASGGAAYSAPVEGASGNVWIPIDFDGTTSEAAVADILLPADYSTGFTETYSWTATSAGGGGVVWGTELACIGDNVAMDASWGTQVLVTDTFQTSGALHISGTSATTTPSGSCAAGKTLAVRVKRMPAEAGDTMSDDARFLGMSLTYTKAGA